MTRRIVIALLLLALAGLVIGGITWAYEAWRSSVLDEGDARGASRIQGEWDADVRKRDAQKLAAVAAAIEKTRREAADAAKGERDARERAEQRAAAYRAAADRSAGAAGSLRDSIDALDRAARDLDLTNVAACPAELGRQREAAVLARQLLGACSQRYRELAADVDDAWNAVTLKLDTALGYINAVTR